MSDKSILDGLLKFEWWLIDRENDDEYVRVKDVEARLAAQPARSEWVSVEDRLPDENVGVLVTDGGRIATGYLFLNTWMPHEIYGNDAEIAFDHLITYWMPLPPPPK